MALMAVPDILCDRHGADARPRLEELGVEAREKRTSIAIYRDETR
jgi:hypothetical protein